MAMLIKRSVVQHTKGMTIIESYLGPLDRVMAQITAVDREKGRNVSIGLDSKCVDTLVRHRRELLRRRRSQSSKEARRRRLREIGEE